VLALALASLFLLLFDPGGAVATELAAAGQRDAEVTLQPAAQQAKEPARAPAEQETVAEATTKEARRAAQGISEVVRANMPRLALVLGILVIAWASVRVVRTTIRRLLGAWPQSMAIAAIFAVSVWALAIGVSFTILAGDVRAFLGSVGLLGLAASWALQTPIESFTGWLLNAFRGYYRVGDRIEVGEIVGDVYRIDVLTTTIWEIGNPFKPGHVHAEQPTGRLITLPNNQVLTGAVTNFTRDFPYVWDEVHIQVANESELRYAARVLEQAAGRVLGDGMAEAARQYQSILQRTGLEESVPEAPQVFVTLEESYTGLHVRYLVHTRVRRRTKTDLALCLTEELRRPEHACRIISAVPRHQVQLVAIDGRARDAVWFAPPASPSGERPQSR
jgi:small-conductance mechanosensitive channel